jgi:hypothetical protein
MSPKIAIYGFGSFPVVCRPLIELATAQALPIKWCAILPQPNYRAIMREVLPLADLLDVYEALPRTPVGGPLSCLAHYPGSLVEDLAAQKFPRRKRSSAWLRDRGIDYYLLYKNFLVRREATHILMSGIETPDAKIAIAAAQEIGISVVAPSDMRSLTGTYFSSDAYQAPPDYGAPSLDARTRAAEFVRNFRGAPTSATGEPTDIRPSPDDQVILNPFLPQFWMRVKQFLQMAAERPDVFDYDLIRVSVMVNFALLRTSVRGARARLNTRQFDISNVGSLPERFVFYPLQYTPESSINVPAPYFVDQMRVVDALRFAMPSDCMLVIKEHPACLEMRPPKFMRQLRSRPGLLVAKCSIPSIELVRRAAATITVTGTAALEAFLLGRPALTLGTAVPTWVLDGATDLRNLRAEIRRAIDQPPSDELVIERVARLMNVRYRFLFTTPHLPGEPMLRLGNMRRFLAALVDHLDRTSRLATTDIRLAPSTAPE